MIFTETSLKGAYIIDVEKKRDSRGFFGRLWCENEMNNIGLNTNIVQSNISYSSKKGTLRGMHYQKSPMQETKLVRCTKGAIYDVIIDLRPESPTFKKWYGVELSERNCRMIYVPENFAHGFITLEDESEIYYLVTQFYDVRSEMGIRWDDPNFKIEWPINISEISEKDSSHKDFGFT